MISPLSLEINLLRGLANTHILVIACSGCHVKFRVFKMINIRQSCVTARGVPPAAYTVFRGVRYPILAGVPLSWLGGQA